MLMPSEFGLGICSSTKYRNVSEHVASTLRRVAGPRLVPKILTVDDRDYPAGNPFDGYHFLLLIEPDPLKMPYSCLVVANRFAADMDNPCRVNSRCLHAVAAFPEKLRIDGLSVENRKQLSQFVRQILLHTESLRESFKPLVPSLEPIEIDNLCQSIQDVFPKQTSTKTLIETIEFAQQFETEVMPFFDLLPTGRSESEKLQSCPKLLSQIKKMESSWSQAGTLLTPDKIAAAFDEADYCQIAQVYADYDYLRPRFLDSLSLEDIDNSKQHLGQVRKNNAWYRAAATGRLLELHGVDSPLAEVDKIESIMRARKKQSERVMRPVIADLQRDMSVLEDVHFTTLEEKQRFASAVMDTVRFLNGQIQCPKCKAPATLKVTKTKTSPDGLFQFGHRSTSHLGSMKVPRFQIVSTASEQEEREAEVTQPREAA